MSEYKKSCFTCSHYTDSIGENGYCKLYRHNTDSPEVACSKYEQKSATHKPTAQESLNANIKEKCKQPLNKGFYISSVFGCMIFSVFFVLFGIVIAFTVSSLDSVELLTKVIFIISTVVFTLSLVIMLYMLVLRFSSMRFIVSVLSLIFLIGMLVFYDSAWSAFNNFALNLIKIVFGQP